MLEALVAQSWLILEITPDIAPPGSEERITESGEIRITEDGQVRVTEGT
jgi:hypothetical protein